MRMDTLASTRGEFEALREWLARDERAAAILDVYFAEGEDDLFRREDAHAERLESGRPFPPPLNPRVTD
jgi:hypothetical protein